MPFLLYFIINLALYLTYFLCVCYQCFGMFWSYMLIAAGHHHMLLDFG
jgi:hypothetical protein